MKKNKLLMIFIFVLVFIVNMNICFADVYKGTLTGESVNLRSGPGTNYSSLKTLTKGSAYTLVDDTLHKSESDDCDGWYKMYYEGSATGFVCSKYMTIEKVVYNETPTKECEKKFSDLGFPSSYWPSLCSLSEAHSNWQFKPILTGLDWSSAVESESACGKSYIASSVPTNIDTTCKNQYTKTWYPASSSAVAYYMDPRNWLTENYIFQFEYLKYDEGLKELYPGAVTNIISNAEFYKYHNNLGNNLGEVISQVGSEENVSPIFISSRILQEMGSSTSLYNLYSGVYEGYQGFYNFYNFGVSDVCATTYGTSYCGLEYAKKNNWSGLHAAIKGGASQIASGYINKGQYTNYLQKYNVVPVESNKLYGHQYMTNIAAPSSEAKTAYNTYKKLNLLDNVFAFYIPVYNNMNDKNYADNNGAVEVPDEETKTTVDISTIVVSSGFKYASNQISGIKPNTKVSAVKSALESISGANSITIKNAKDTLVSDGLIGTGFKVVIDNFEKSETLEVIINGDTSGDGIINALDLLQVQKNILGTYTLSGSYKLAGDTSDDGVVNALDLLQVQKSILGTYTIEQ